jgi:hypothetical protein
MTTKEYLQQIGKLNKMINNKMIELAQMKEMAYSIKAVGTDERVMSSSDPDKTGCAYAEIRLELAKEKHLYFPKKQRHFQTSANNFCWLATDPICQPVI